MEDGDVIDALLQQACAHLISHCLRSSSRVFRSEVAHAFVHNLSIFDLESHVDSPSTVCVFFRVVPINPPIYYPKDNFVLNLSSNQRHREGLLSTPSDADVR